MRSVFASQTFGLIEQPRLAFGQVIRVLSRVERREGHARLVAGGEGESEQWECEGEIVHCGGGEKLLKEKPKMK